MHAVRLRDIIPYILYMSLPEFAIQNSAPEFVQNAIGNCQNLCYYVDGTAMAVPGAVTQRNIGGWPLHNGEGFPPREGRGCHADYIC